MKSGKWIVFSVLAGSLSLNAMAQDKKPDQPPPPRAPGEGGPGGGPGGGQGMPGMGFGGRQLSPERAKAAWDLEASGVAHRLGVQDDKAKAVASAYAAARESQESAAEKLRSEAMQKAQEGGNRMEAMRDALKKVDELTAGERDKLKTSLTGIIGAEQADKAIIPLGTFSRQWDNITDTFGTFKLDASKQQEGLNAIEDYAVNLDAAQKKIRANAAGGGQVDREAMRAANQEGRQKLIDAMGKILNKEQMIKLEESLPGAGRGPGGGGRRPGGGGS